MPRHRILAGLVVLATLQAVAAADPAIEKAWQNNAWKRHVIDSTSRGADGVRPMDVNGDGLSDLCVGWEEGGIIRAYLHPGRERVMQPWPRVTVGQVAKPEDAVFVDVDGDGAVDIVSSCEGKTRSLFIHWAPPHAKDYLQSKAWQTEILIASKEKAAWMFALPWPRPGVDATSVDLVVGAKGEGAAVGQFTAAANPRNSHAWNWQPLVEATWIMSLVKADMDDDGDDDILFSDRKGPNRGIHWLESRPEAGDSQSWPLHTVGGTDREVMFLDHVNVETKPPMICAATRDGGILLLRRQADGNWSTQEIPLPPDTGTGKSVRSADIDLDGELDLVFSCENAKGKHGVMWLSRKASEPLESATWAGHPISGDQEGTKFDLLQLIDLDQDGDLDVLTCEERDNLGVIWYENPSR